MRFPYVISAELDLADADYFNTKNLDAFRENLDRDLRAMGKDTVWIPSDSLRSGLSRLTKTTTLPVVSLDDRYITDADAWLGISRGVDGRLDDIGYVPRAGYPSLEKQLGRISHLGSEIIIADDVLFSGETLAWVADNLAARGVTIGGVACGIATGEGIEKLDTLGIEVAAVESFTKIEDELCERDFAVMPGSGRRLPETGANTLYFDPRFGRPAPWASIPASAATLFASKNYNRAASLLSPGVALSSIGNFFGLREGLAADVLKDAAIRLGDEL